MRRRAGISTVAAALVVGLAACGPPDFSRRLVGDAPQPEELRGRYRLERQTLGGAADFQPAVEPELRLLAGGRFEARGFPLWRLDQDRWRHEGQIDATGIWRIIPQGDGWGVSLTAPVGRVAMVGRHEEHLQLIFFYGDRESRRAMVFAKR